jgi:hypothetical protein
MEVFMVGLGLKFWTLPCRVSNGTRTSPVQLPARTEALGMFWVSAGRYLGCLATVEVSFEWAESHCHGQKFY